MPDDRQTVKLHTDTWKRLNSRKEPGDSFDDVVARLLDQTDQPVEATSD